MVTHNKVYKSHIIKQMPEIYIMLLSNFNWKKNRILNICTNKNHPLDWWKKVIFKKQSNDFLSSPRYILYSSVEIHVYLSTRGARESCSSRRTRRALKKLNTIQELLIKSTKTNTTSNNMWAHMKYKRQLSR